MKQAIGLGLAAMAFVLSACSNDPPPPEQKGSTTSNLTGGGGSGGAENSDGSGGDGTSTQDCVRAIQAPPGSADWRAELQQCIDDAVSGATAGRGGSDNGGGGNGGGGAPGGGGGGGDDDDGTGGNGQSCTSGIACMNGACQCTSGPNQGQPCDGAGSGADSCSSLCSTCQ